MCNASREAISVACVLRYRDSNLVTMIPLFILMLFSLNGIASPPELIELRGAMRNLLSSRHCMLCHTPGLSTAKDKALRIYDLSSEQWYSKLSERQLHKLEEMINTDNTRAELEDMGWKKSEKPLTSSQKKTVSEFVKREIEYRHTGGIHYLLEP